MANLKDIRKRIGSVKNTQKITRAMKLVAAARLRKAQQNITEMRPYAIKTFDMLSMLAARIDDSKDHPLLARREAKQVLIVLMTSDRGLAGAFNSSLNREAFKLWKKLEAEGSEVTFAVVGRKGRDFLKRRDAVIDKEFTGVFEKLSLEKANEVGRYIINRYAPFLEKDEAKARAEGRSVEYTVVESDLDAAYLVYCEFKSAISQEVRVETLLPINPTEFAEGESAGEFIYEPDKNSVLSSATMMYVDIEVYRALLESVASEHGSRMTAMDSATNNAGDMIDKLTVTYNRARQAAITTELMEIISGSEALKG